MILSKSGISRNSTSSRASFRSTYLFFPTSHNHSHNNSSTSRSRSHSSNGGVGVRHLNRDVPALLLWILPVDLGVLRGKVAEDGKPSGGEVGRLAEADGAVGEKVENLRALHQCPGGGGSRSGERCAGQ